MFSHKHLALEVVRLKAREKWVSEPNQMFFMFPKRGSGRCVSGAATQLLSPGDVLILNSTVLNEVQPAGANEFTFWFFSVCPEHIFPLFSSSEISLLRNVCEGFKVIKLHGFATPLAQECHRLLDEVQHLSHLEHRGQLLRVISTILEAEVEATQPHLPGFVRAEEHLLQVLENVSIDDLVNLS